MTKGLQRSLSRGPKTQRDVITDRIQIRTGAIEVDGASGVGFGSVVVGDFPAGNILLLGAAGYLTLTETSDDIQATFSGDFAVGTTPAGDATLTGADVDILPSTALGPAVASVTPRTRAVNATAAMLDNTDGSLELNLNVLIDDANISGDDATGTFDLDLDITYVVLGDD